MASPHSALPAVAPAYHLYGDTADDAVHRETRRLVSILEQYPDHPAAGEVRDALSRRGVIVPIRRGQLPLGLSGSSAAHYDALILAQENEIVAWTPQGFGPPTRRTRKPRRTHVLAAAEAREKLAAFAGTSDAFLCPNEFRGWRQRRLLTALNALYCDIDFHDDGVPTLDWMRAVAEDRIRHLDQLAFPLPSLVVYSGRGFHLYWSHGRLDESELARWTEVQKWLQAALDGDARATDATRYLRLIGSVNSKTGGEVSAERIGPAYEFNALYRRYLAAVGREASSVDNDIELAQWAEMEGDPTAVRAEVFDIRAFGARRGRRTTLQSGIYRWFDLVYRDVRRIIDHHGWQGAVPEGHRNRLLYHLAVALAWFTEADALEDEITRQNVELIGLPADEASANTASIVRAARASVKAKRQLAAGTGPSVVIQRAQGEQRLQAQRARLGEFRYGASRRQLWRDLGPLVPDALVPHLRAIIPDDVWLARRRERDRERDRVAEGRYRQHWQEYTEMLSMRRLRAKGLRESGCGWAQIGDILGVSAEAARKLASRA